MPDWSRKRPRDLNALAASIVGVRAMRSAVHHRPSYMSTAAITFAILSLGVHGVGRFLVASTALVVVVAMVLDDRQARAARTREAAPENYSSPE